ncbi:leucine-rich repeat-containing protein 23 isoform X2 [Oncorhynchus kisutch]|uniref:Leucine-rich repeat-containing protein 23 n=1 Tax=Oncorhynchus kisutch TaxID=8019 RepID=A0A8C7DGM2_ONCKI|nr:leucine-rich repeat-containing protein 23-like isoform X2 [Oncorhynchus kisutch]
MSEGEEAGALSEGEEAGALSEGEEATALSEGEEAAALSEGEEAANEDGQEENMSEKEDQIEPCPLTKEILIPGLSLLCRTGNGLAHAFVKLQLENRRLTDMALVSSFVHLRFLDVSSNHLSDLSPLAALTQLLWLKGDGNMVAGFRGQPLGQLTYLQWLSLALNRLKDLEGLEGLGLESLNLIGNGIQRVSGLRYHHLTNLVTLELRGNKLETTDGIYLPNLRRLYLAQNTIKRLEGLGKLERLTTLHLRDNQLETLDGISPNMKALQYLNIRGNLVSAQRALRSLVGVSRTLRALVLAENPLVETEDYRLCVLSRLPLLERLDKEPISPEEKSEAQEKLREFNDEVSVGAEEY